ncbi:MAG: adenylyl-sulfate kinase [Flavobacteriales bacterium]|nr:adenylyl-sulfate kinase [Flavobacteriales bacterium]
MKDEGGNIYSVFDEILSRKEKEELLKQHSIVLWMTGLSGSGKTTIAKALERLMHEDGYLTELLDGDNIRSGINKNLGFSDEDRTENIRRIAEISKLFVNCGVITINCFVSPTKAIRQQAKEIIGEADFVEVFIDTPLEICEQRDPKGLYKKARKGEIKDFTGISAPFEAPEDAVVIKTEGKEVAECAKELYEHILPKIGK